MHPVRDLSSLDRESGPSTQDLGVDWISVGLFSSMSNSIGELEAPQDLQVRCQSSVWRGIPSIEQARANLVSENFNRF